MRKAAEAKAALEDLGKTSGSVTATQIAAEQKLAAERSKEIDALKREAGAADVTAEAYKRYNVQALYGGRSEMGAHLTDMRQELEYETLLNRQRWLLFTSPQQAYAWRQNEYNQRLLMNRAEFAGYFTADQYLSYLQKQIALYRSFNAELRDRSTLYKSTAESANAYYNALTGSHKTLGQLGTNLDLSGLAAFTAAVNAVPDQNTTILAVDDQQGMAKVAEFTAALNAIPDVKTTVLNVVSSGGAQLTPETVTEHVNAITSAPSAVTTTYTLNDAQMKAELARITAELHQIPPRVDITANFDDAKAKAEMAAFIAFTKAHRTFGVTEDVNVVAAGGAGKGGGGGSPPVAAAAPVPPDNSGWNAFLALIAKLRAQMAQWDAAVKASNIDMRDYMSVVQQARSVTAAQEAALKAETAVQDAEGTSLANSAAKMALYKQAQDALKAASAERLNALEAAVKAAEASQSANAAETVSAAALSAQLARLSNEFFRLAAAESNQADATRLANAAMEASRLAAASLTGESRAYIGQLVQQIAATDNVKAKTDLMWVASQKAVAAFHDSGGAAAAAVPALGEFAGGLFKAQGAFALLSKVALFGGVFSVSLWHLLADAIVEFGIALGGAVIGVAALAAALGIFVAAAALAQDTLGRIADRMKAVQTTVAATGQAVYPLTQNFDKLATVIRPQVFELLGAALNAVSGKMGVFSKIAESTGFYLDRLSAKVLDFINNPAVQSGFSHLIQAGVGFAKQFGQIFVNLGQVIYHFFQAAQLTHVAEDIGRVVIALTHLAAVVTGALPPWLLALALGMHAIYLWGGLAATAVVALLDPLRALALALVGVKAADTALAGLGEGATGAQRLKAVITDLGSAFSLMPTKIGLAGIAVRDFFTSAAARQSAFTALVGIATKAWPLLAIAAAAGLGYIIFRLVTAKDATQQWIDQLQRGIQGAPVQQSFAALSNGFQQVTAKINQNMQQYSLASSQLKLSLGGLTMQAGQYGDQLSKVDTVQGQYGTQLKQSLMQQGPYGAQLKYTNEQLRAQGAAYGGAGSGMAAALQRINELRAAQAQLDGEQNRTISFAGTVARLYGTNVSGALALAGAAGVKYSDIISKNTKDQQRAMTQINDLVTGYRAMGQGLSQLQGDISVQLVMGSDQLKQMQNLNKVWDSWLTLVQSGPTALDAYLTGVQTLNTDLKVAGTSFGGFNQQSLAARTQFDQLIPQMGQVLDAVRSYNATLQNGADGSRLLVRATKDVIASSGLLTTTNQGVRNSLIAVAEQADPSVNTWQKLTHWIGKEGATAAASDLQSVMLKLQTPVANLASDANKLASAIGQDTAAMAKQAVESTLIVPLMDKLVLDMRNHASAATLAKDRQSLYNAELRVTGSQHEAAVAVQTITGAMSGNAAATGKAKDVWKQMSDQYKASAGPLGQLTGDQKNLTAAIELFGAKSPQAQAAAAKLTGDLRSQGVSANQAQAEVKALTDKIVANGNLTAAQQKNRATLTGDMQKILDKAPGAKKDIADLATAVETQGTNSDKYKGARKTLIGDLEKAGLNAKDATKLVDDLTGALKKVPAKVPVDISVQEQFTFAANYVQSLNAQHVSSPSGNFNANIGHGDAGGLVAGYAAGAIVGPHQQGQVAASDTVPAMLTPGEFVLRKGAVDALQKQFGPGVLARLNNADRSGTTGHTGPLSKAAQLLGGTGGGAAPAGHAAGGMVGYATGGSVSQQIAGVVNTAVSTTIVQTAAAWNTMAARIEGSLKQIGSAVAADSTAFAHMWSAGLAGATALFAHLSALLRGELPTWVKDDTAAISGMWTASGKNLNRDLSAPTRVYFGAVGTDAANASKQMGSMWQGAGASLNKDLSAPTRVYFGAVGTDAANASKQMSTLFAGAGGSLSKDLSAPTHTYFSDVGTWTANAGRQFSGLWSGSDATFTKDVSDTSLTYFRNLGSWLATAGRQWQSTWSGAQNYFNAHIVSPLQTFFETTLARSYFTYVGQAWTLLWGIAGRVTFPNAIENPLRGWFETTLSRSIFTYVGQAWTLLWGIAGKVTFPNAIEKPLQTWFQHTLPSAMEGGFKNSMQWIVRNGIDPIVNWINTISGGVGIAKIKGPSGFAAGGEASRQAQHGSVAGSGEHDNVPAVLMPGEYVVRKSARAAMEATYGRGVMEWINQADTHLGGGSRGTRASHGYAGGGEVYPWHAAGGPMAAGGYANPLRAVRGLTPMRIDMGVDYGGSGPVYAIGPGVIVNTTNSGWPGGAFITEKLTAGPDAGMYVYAAEHIAPSVRVGQTVDSSTRIGTLLAGYPFSEWGFAAPPGTGQTMAAAQHQQNPSGDPGAWPTGWGVAMSNLLHSLGAPPGILTGKVHGTATAGVGNVNITFGTSALNAFVKQFGQAGQVLATRNPSFVKAAKANALTFDQLWSNLVNPLEQHLGILPGKGVTPNLAWVGLTDVHKAVDSEISAAEAAAAAAMAANIPGGISAGSATQNLLQLARYLMSHGATRAAAAGIAGDVYGESGGNPEAVGSGGFGLIGWTGNTIGLPPGYHGPTGNVSRDLAIQIAGTLGYINANGGLGPINAAGGSSNYVAAGQEFSSRYERPAVRYSDTRPSVAAQIYGLLGGSVAAATQLGNTVAQISAHATAPHGAAGGLIIPGGVVRGGVPLPAYATGGRIDGLDWTDYSVPVPRQWTASSPVPFLGSDMPAPLVPFHSTSSVPWNDAIDAAWAAQDKLDRDWNNLMVSASHPTGSKFLSLVHDTYEELKYWNTIAEYSLPSTLPKATNYGAILSNETSDISLLAQAGYSNLSQDVTAVRSHVAELAALWPQLWGPHANKSGSPSPRVTPGPVVQLPPPSTPGPQGTAVLHGVPSVNLQPYASAGGPGTPFSPAGAGTLGFDKGGGVEMFAAGGRAGTLSMPTLSQVAGQFGIIVPGRNGYIPVPIAAVGGLERSALDRAHRAAAPSRSLSEAGAASSRIGVNISGDMVINNPRPEKPSDSIARSNQRLAVLAGRGA